MEDKDIAIDNRLKELRKKSKLSQEELADQLGISRQSIIALEQGKYLPSLPLAVSMCQFFDTAFEEVFNFQHEVEQQLNDVLDGGGINIKIINPESGDPTSLKLCGERKEKNMTNLEPWRPFRESVSLRDAMDRLFEDSFITPAKASGGMPKIDIKDKKTEVIVRAELPGIKEEDVNIEIMDNVMTISGEKLEEKEEKTEDDGYYYKESHTGVFSRSFSLPSDVVAEKASAEMKNGVLTITIHKVEPKKAKKIEIKKK